MLLPSSSPPGPGGEYLLEHAIAKNAAISVPKILMTWSPDQLWCATAHHDVCHCTLVSHVDDPRDSEELAPSGRLHNSCTHTTRCDELALRSGRLATVD